MVDNIRNQEDLPQADYPTLQWAESAPPIQVMSRTDLEKYLRDLAKQNADRPIIAEESILFLQGAPGPDGWTEEWLPIVEEERGGGTEFFLLGWHHSEFENRRLLTIGDAIRAMGEFFENEDRPGWIRWEENKF
jgi:hypothetical protein